MYTRDLSRTWNGATDPSNYLLFQMTCAPPSCKNKTNKYISLFLVPPTRGRHASYMPTSRVLWRPEIYSQRRCGPPVRVRKSGCIQGVHRGFTRSDICFIYDWQCISSLGSHMYIYILYKSKTGELITFFRT